MRFRVGRILAVIAFEKCLCANFTRQTCSITMTLLLQHPELYNPYTSSPCSNTYCLSHPPAIASRINMNATRLFQSSICIELFPKQREQIVPLHFRDLVPCIHHGTSQGQTRTPHSLTSQPTPNSTNVKFPGPTYQDQTHDL